MGKYRSKRKDPYFLKILEGLEHPLDPDLFEEIIPQLLQTDHPGIVPIPGGSDKGMDGAFPVEGTGFCPLVTTTGKDPIGNLQRNLESFLKAGINCRKVIFATSNPLNQNTRLKLIQVANSRGFILLAIYDQSGIAQRLYANPRITNELLGISGHPPALSILPRGKRSFLEINLIGREDELIWIKEKYKDKLLVGQPGVGKSFLLHKFVLEGGCYFIVQDNLELIANEIREKEPKYLIFDNVHTYIELLDQVIQFRDNSALQFKVICTCWPNYIEQIKAILNLSDEDIFYLDRLGRSQMVEIVKEMGIYGPDNTIRYILDMAEGKPGLAAVFVQALKNGDVERLNSGDTILDEVFRFVDPKEKGEVESVLAAFALGGDTGMRLDVVAKVFGYSPLRIKSIISNLQAGGIIFSGYDGFSVRPVILRYALVKNVFFPQGLQSISNYAWDFLSYSPNLASSVETILGAKSQGAIIDNVRLLPWLDKCPPKTWKYFATLDEWHTNWVIENRPELLSVITNEALQWTPSKIIPHLLKLAEKDNRNLNSNPDHPLRQIDDWIKKGNPRSEEPIVRRKILLEVVRHWLDGNNNVLLGLKGIEIALSPKFEYYSSDPGLGTTISFYSGILGINQLRDIQLLWKEIFTELHNLHVDDWSPITNLITNWAFPGVGNLVIHEEVYKEIDETVKMMIIDLSSITYDSYGVQLFLKELVSGKNYQLDFNFNVPPEFELIFGTDKNITIDFEAYKRKENKRFEQITKLGKKWSNEKPESIVEQLEDYIKDSKYIYGNAYQRLYRLAKSISEDVDYPMAWINEIVQKEIFIDFISPFLYRALELDRDSFVEFSINNFDNPKLRNIIITINLGLEELSDELEEKIFYSDLNQYGNINILIIQEQISRSNIQKLLKHPNKKVSLETAVSVWDQYQRHQKFSELIGECKVIIQNADPKDFRNSLFGHIFEGIITSNHDIAFHWIRKIFRRAKNMNIQDLMKVEEIIVKSVYLFSIDERLVLLEDMPANIYLHEFVIALVGDNIDIYQKLLDLEMHFSYYLLPLSNPNNRNWIPMVKLALSKEIPHAEIANIIITGPIGVYDPSIQEWNKRIDVFEKLIELDDVDIQKIGELGKLYSINELNRKKEIQRQEEIYGI